MFDGLPNTGLDDICLGAGLFVRPVFWIIGLTKCIDTDVALWVHNLLADHLFIDHPPDLVFVFREVYGLLRITLGLHPQFGEEAQIALVALDRLLIERTILEECPR